MGLDTYAYNPKGEIDKEKFSHITHLVGGMFSGNGEGSFRGKVYDRLVEEVTGESLYQAEIEPEVVKEMYRELKHYKPKRYVEMEEEVFDANKRKMIKRKVIADDEYGIKKKELKDLIEFFRVCAENKYGLRGWW